MAVGLQLGYDLTLACDKSALFTQAHDSDFVVGL